MEKCKNYLMETIINYSKKDSIENIDKYEKLERQIKSLTEDEAKDIVLSLLEDISPDRKSVMSGAGLYFGGVDYVLYRAIRGKFDKCSKACGTYALNTPKRQICMAKCNMVKWQNIVDSYKKNHIGGSKLSNAQMKLLKAQKKYKEYAEYAKQTGRNPDPKVIPGTKSRFRIPR